MPVHVEKRNDMWRIIEPSGKIATSANGKPRDGGGHRSKAKATKQAWAINAPKDTDRKTSTRMKRGPVSAGIRG